MKNTMGRLGLAAIACAALLGAGCGGHYDDELDVGKLPTAALNFGAANFPSGSYYLDIKGAFANGSATTTGAGACRTTFGGCYALGASTGESTSGVEGTLCPGIWNFTDSATTPGSIKLRDTITTGTTCDFNVPALASCVIDGTFNKTTSATTPTGAPVLVDSATVLAPGYQLRLRAGTNNVVRVTCTLSTSSVTFDVGIQ